MTGFLLLGCVENKNERREKEIEPEEFWDDMNAGEDKDK